MSRIAAKKALRRLRRENPRNRSQINQILRDPENLDLFVEEMTFRCGTETKSPMDWFTYLIENWDTVLSVIKALILIFGEEEE